MGRTARRMAACAALLSFWGTPGNALDRPGDFDFYVLALSWSPTFCATEADAEMTQQCRAGAGHRFILHGLWPQYEEGYPEYCGDGDSEHIPAALAASVEDLTPDPGLIRHTWRKHGTCTGLPPEVYFATARAAAERIEIPAAFVRAGSGRRVSAEAAESLFATANPGLNEDAIAVSCESGWFKEIRICLTRDLAFRACDEVDRRGCRQGDLRLPAPDRAP